MRNPLVASSDAGVYLLGLAAVLSSGLIRSGLCQYVDNPSNDNFLRRPFPALTVIGDYLYIDGGEVSQLVDGKAPPSTRPSAIVNSTMSINLKESFTNATITYKKTSRTSAPPLKEGAIWTDASTSSFYSWAGSTAYAAQPPANELWKFSADGSGGGSWSQVTNPLDVVSFSSLVKPNQCASVTDPKGGTNGVGYCMGGYVTSNTDTSVSGSTQYALPGMVSFDMSTGAVSNLSTNAFGNFGTLVAGRALAVPFGSSSSSASSSSTNTSNLILFIGGAESPVKGYPTRATHLSFANLTIYDPSTRKWHSQTTTGSRPTARERFCAVGVAGENSTYEIFLYGGTSTQATQASDEVYVLTLPGFVFFKAPQLPGSTGRGDHACAVVGAGRRQMISVGGTDGLMGFPKSLLDKDPWTQGVGVFDMTEMRWTGGYDAGAPAYRSPEVVRQWYRQGGLNSVPWSSAEVRALFAGQASSTSGAGPSSTDSSSSSQSSPSKGDGQNNPSSPPQSASISTGAIVGASVGGTAALAAVAGLLAFLVVRRRRQRRQQQGDILAAVAGRGGAELPTTNTAVAAGAPPGAWGGDKGWYGGGAYGVQAGGDPTPPHAQGFAAAVPVVAEMPAAPYPSELHADSAGQHGPTGVVAQAGDGDGSAYGYGHANGHGYGDGYGHGPGPYGDGGVVQGAQGLQNPRGY